MRMLLLKLVLLWVFVPVFAHAAVTTQLGLQEIASGLSSPVLVSAAPGDSERLYIVLQGGQIVVHENGSLRPTPMLNITTRLTSGGERGLLGLAFHPQYQSNGYFYVNSTRTVNSQLRTYITRYTQSDTATAATVDPATELEILSFDQPFANHNGGTIAFGPKDKYLYIGTGDGGSGNDPFGNAQSTFTLLGKMLRIDVDLNGADGGEFYDIPPDNPLYASLSARPEIWAYGLRNPYRFSFDRLSGDLWIGDVGQNDWEEIDYQSTKSAGGENYGWRTFEASQCNLNVITQTECDNLQTFATFPVHAYPNSEDGRAVIGGNVYRGAGLPGLDGHYFFGDNVNGRVWSFKGPNKLDFTEWTTLLDSTSTLLDGLSAFGEGPDGELYITVLGGRLYKIVDVTPAEGEGSVGAIHSADTNSDGIIGLSELLRIIQFYNASALHCETGTEDGFAPLSGDQTCAPHDTDYRPQDWKINLSELLRAVQFFNALGLVECLEGEDGYCPVFN